ncbi:PP0621 family protein [Kushneria sp. EE4]
MARLIILAALLWLGWLFYRRLKRQRRPHPPTPASGEAMVRCAYCHVHVSRHNALEDPHVNEVSRHLPGDRHWFCCQDHQARFISNGPQPRRRSP